MVNDAKKDVLFEKLSIFFGLSIFRLTVALRGLAFKTNIDDMREAWNRRFLEAAWTAGVRERASPSLCVKRRGVTLSPAGPVNLYFANRVRRQSSGAMRSLW